MEKGVAVLGGGSTVAEVLKAAKEKGAHISKCSPKGTPDESGGSVLTTSVIGTCNSVGAISSITGGGIGFMMVSSATSNLHTDPS